ncbi:MAG: hypothetical protein WCW84_05765 [Sulfurimonas sp.]
MFDSIKKALIQNREDDALLYEYVLTEIENDVILKGLWAKAMALSEGYDNKIQPLYMQYRVQSIKDEFTKLNIAYKELTKEPLFRKIAAVFAEPAPTMPSQSTAVEQAVPVEKPIADNKVINTEIPKDIKSAIIQDGYSFLSKSIVRDNATWNDYNVSINTDTVILKDRSNGSIVKEYNFDKFKKYSSPPSLTYIKI